MAWPRASSTAADMAARWSRLRGVAHLKRQRWFGEDEEVEGLTVVRWSRRFGQWSCGLGEWLERGRCFASPVTTRARWRKQRGREW
jgi:hypothetical protein